MRDPGNEIDSFLDLCQNWYSKSTLFCHSCFGCEGKSREKRLEFAQPFFSHGFLFRHAQQTKQKRNRVVEVVNVFLSKMVVGAVRNWSPFD